MATRKDAIPGLELADGEPTIEPVSQNADLRTLIADEAFMNEQVEVEIYPATDENQPNHVILNCNGTNQVVVRGRPILIKRKYLEILARMKETRYHQETPNASEPDNIRTIPRTGLVYPFNLHNDPNPRGREWLKNVLAEPA